MAMTTNLNSTRGTIRINKINWCYGNASNLQMP
uniref:Uncharacterized protein n=1 Tax=Rhizophora mucronata TaxID=61149 RepID=A0A2P2QDC7_RHIMU